MGRREFKIRQEQRGALTIVQRNVRKYIGMKIWIYLWSRVKPLINQPNLENAIRDLKVRSDASVGACKEAEDKAEFLENQQAELKQEILDLKEEVEATAGNASSFIENFALIGAQKAELEKTLADTETRFVQEQEAKNELSNQKKLVEMELSNQKKL